MSNAPRDHKVYVFDLDGVIRYWDPEIVRSAEGDHGMPAGSLFGTAFEAELLHSAITGAITDTAWRREVVARLAVAYPDADSEAAVAAWSGPHGEIIADALDVLSDARSRGTVCLLTNATDRLAADLRLLGLDTAFDHVFNSSAIGFCKPDNRIFTHVEECLGASPEDIVFFDDSQTNVEAAVAHGWQAVLVGPGNALQHLLANL